MWSFKTHLPYKQDPFVDIKSLSSLQHIVHYVHLQRHYNLKNDCIPLHTRYSKTCVTPHACGKVTDPHFTQVSTLKISYTYQLLLCQWLFLLPHDTSNSSNTNTLKKHDVEKGVHWLFASQQSNVPLRSPNCIHPSSVAYHTSRYKTEARETGKIISNSLNVSLTLHSPMYWKHQFVTARSPSTISKIFVSGMQWNQIFGRNKA